MTPEDWAAVSYLIANAWGQEFSPDREAAYGSVLATFPREVVEATIQRWPGTTWRPSASEIREVVLRQLTPEKPSWTEVWPALSRALRLFPDEAKGLAQVGRQAGPYAVAFAMAKGWLELGRMELCHDVYGPLNVRRLGLEFEAWMESVVERMRDGSSLVDATRVRRLNRGPHRLDALEALGIDRPALTTGGSE
jgi:hypothetical protein